MIERAELPVQRKRTLNGFLSGRVRHDLFPALVAASRARAGMQQSVSRSASCKIANFGMSVAAVGDQRSDQRPHSFNVGAIDDGAAVARATDQAGAGENAEMG